MATTGASAELFSLVAVTDQIMGRIAAGMTVV